VKTKLTGEQKRQIKEIKKLIVAELKYKPRGQGDSINQHLKITNLGREIEAIKANPDFCSRRI
jgi:hypothetical protein